MAAYCPKCNYKLRIRDWRAECPECGVNLMYYGIEESLRKEADVAEYHHAMFQPKVDRLKFSLIGHPLAIVRLAIGLLPIVCMLLPMGTLRYVLPFGVTETRVNLVSAINFLTGGSLDLGLAGKLIGSDLVGKGILFFLIALVALLVTMLVTLVGFFLLCLSCSPKGMQRNLGFAITGMVFATVSFVSFILMIRSFSSSLPGIFTGTVVPWAYLAVMLCFAAMIVVNVMWKKKKIEVKYKDVSELLLPYDERPSTIEKKKAQGKESPVPASASAAAE